MLLNVIGNLSGTGIIQIPIVGSAANSILKDDISKYFDELAEDKILKIAEGLYPIKLAMFDGVLPINLALKKKLLLNKENLMIKEI